MDGPRFVAYLKSFGIEAAKDLARSGNLARSYTRWRAGGAVGIGSADEIFTKVLGRPDLLHLLPTELWRPSPTGAGGGHKHAPYPPELRAKVLREHKAGVRPFELAERYGMSQRTVSNWIKAER